MTTAKSHKSRDEQHRREAGGPSSTLPAAASANPTENSLIGILLGTPSDSVSPTERMELLNEVKDVAREVDQPRELRPEKQNWFRPADSPLRPKALQILAWRTAGHDNKAIAKKLKTSEDSVRQTLYIARKNGWVTEDGTPVEVDIEDELVHNIDRKILRNISASLDGQMVNYQTHEMTLAGAKGRGMFTERIKNDTTIQTSGLVQIQVVRVDPGDLQDAVRQLSPDNVGGTPAYLEGEVCGTSSDSDNDQKALIGPI